MAEVPQRVSLVAQTEKILIEGIVRGRWKIRLPGERPLQRELQVSRGTLRSALGLLARHKLIRIRQGRSCEILLPRGRKVRVPDLSRIAVLTPDKMSRLVSFFVIMMEEFRTRLQPMGVHLDLYHARRYYQADCSKVLTELVEQNPHSGWILLLSTKSMQRWFEERGLPTVVSGSLHTGVRLPSVDINFHAVGRHAGGMMLSRGHRRIALLAPTLENGVVAPGTLKIEEGLREALATGRHPDSELTVVYHPPRLADACLSVDRLLNLPHRPTAILIGHSSTLVTAITHLMQRNVMIPRDLSIVVTHGEPFYAQFVPELTHYEWNAEEFAGRVLQLFRAIFNGSARPNEAVRLMPRFVPGATLAAMAAE